LIILCFLYSNFFSFIKINIEIVRTQYRNRYEIIPVTQWKWEWDKSLIPVRFRYGNWNEFFLQRWVWDSKTHPHLLPPILLAYFFSPASPRNFVWLIMHSEKLFKFQKILWWFVLNMAYLIFKFIFRYRHSIKVSSRLPKLFCFNFF